MGNPFSFFPKRDSKHRLTDIETEEVSLVDKGANKRKFAVIKRDLETNNMSRGPEMFEDINKADATSTEVTTLAAETTVAVVDEKASAILEGMTAGLEKLASLTEMVKSQVEKSETAKPETLAEWKTAMETVVSWATGMAKAHFETVEISKETTEEIAAQTSEAAAAAAVVVPAAVEDKTTTAEVIADAVVAKSAAEILSDVSQTVLDLASTVPTAEDVKKTLAKMDGLFISGGLYVDAYDVEALAAVCNAICEAMYDPNEADEIAAMKKAADKILGEVSKRTVAVSKRVAKANATNAADGKELKIAALMLKALENGLAPKTEEVKTLDADATQKLIDAAVIKAVEAAVTKAVAPITKQNEELATQITTLKTEKAEIAKKLATAMSETQTRGSSAETVTKHEGNDHDLFPMDYNAPSFAELNKQ